MIGDNWKGNVNVIIARLGYIRTMMNVVVLMRRQRAVIAKGENDSYLDPPSDAEATNEICNEDTQ